MKILFAIFLSMLCSSAVLAQRKTMENYLLIARNMIEHNQEEKALPYLDTILYNQPYHKEALFLRGRINSNFQQYQVALTDYLKLIKIEPENKEVMYGCGVVRYHLGQYRMAVSTLRRCLEMTDRPTNTAYFKIDPWHHQAMGISTVNHMGIEIWNLIGLCHYQLCEYESAVVAFNEGMKIGDGSADLLVNRALAYEASGQIDFAKADYTSALNMVPEHESASLNMMQLHSESEQLELVNSFIASHPNHPQGFTKRGLIHYNNLDYQSAEKDFEVAFELSPENNDYLFNVALAKLKTGNLKESEEYFMELVERDPHRAAGYFNLGNIHYALKSFEEACSYYTLAIQLEPNMPSYLYNRAVAYYENGQQEKACEDMTKAHLLNPEVGNDFLIKYCSSY